MAQWYKFVTVNRWLWIRFPLDGNEMYIIVGSLYLSDLNVKFNLSVGTSVCELSDGHKYYLDEEAILAQ